MHDRMRWMRRRLRWLLLFGNAAAWLPPAGMASAESVDYLRGYAEDLYRQGEEFITVFHGFLSEEQCRHLTDLAKQADFDEVRDVVAGGSSPKLVRWLNSSYFFLGYWKDRLTQQVADDLEHYVLQTPQRYWEPMQVTYFAPGGFYRKHKDGLHRTLKAIL
eukprot:TRINITY_DN32860_c0_g1_i2.p1 TRINITY_DN32860_c0_g1~~TRINITY_DN32860_c0_g1_i2.p1  ORF type:complete len:179 (+),score=22.55 TRINITY_DN32860_c0_g1_i2:56-538(+)